MHQLDKTRSMSLHGRRFIQLAMMPHLHGVEFGNLASLPAPDKRRHAPVRSFVAR